MGILLAYLTVQSLLLLIIPAASFNVWRVEFESPSDRHVDTPTITPQTASVLFTLLRSLVPAASNPQWKAADPRIRSLIVSYMFIDTIWIFQSSLLALLTDTTLSLLTNWPQKQRTSFRLYLVCLYVLATLVSLTPRLRSLYLIASTKMGSGHGRTLGNTAHDGHLFPGYGVRLSSSSGLSTAAATTNPVLAAAAARARRATSNNNTDGPNLFGMNELKMDQENAALKKELDSKIPNTGLDAMLGFGLKMGAKGDGTGIEKFYGKGHALGGKSSDVVAKSDATEDARKIVAEAWRGKEVRQSYEKID
ncbi:hypothetical protein CcCBS67573_g09457 [Chytriomyces confervae]|uniref:Uncharacterized protein n=1 Tax=Chytriomyces confervae TaxID=246404 RepID=A0A507DW39_9FUNG|nr:hypothetical protein CcCBS67573_g09457 [Chytriomyces confervae]